MYRTHALALLALTASTTARADETAWGAGNASIYIGSATPYVNLSVSNTSGSSDPDHRDLRNATTAVDFSLEGQAFCQSVLGGEPRLAEVELMFGNPVVTASYDGTSIIDIGVWDQSAPIVFGGGADSADVSFDHAIALPESWNGGVYFGFNPVQEVEERLATYVENGGTAADFLRTDDVFEVDIQVNLVATCEVDDDGHLWVYQGYTRRSVTAAIFYHGDPNIQDQVTVLDMPGNDVLYGLDEAIVLTVASARTRASSRAGGDVRGEEGGGRTVSYDRFPMYDDQTGSFSAMWSGLVTYPELECSDAALPASTPDGDCVWVEGCVPAEFGSCRDVAGCCDAAPASDATGGTATDGDGAVR